MLAPGNFLGSLTTAIEYMEYRFSLITSDFGERKLAFTILLWHEIRRIHGKCFLDGKKQFLLKYINRNHATSFVLHDIWSGKGYLHTLYTVAIVLKWQIYVGEKKEKLTENAVSVLEITMFMQSTPTDSLSSCKHKLWWRSDRQYQPSRAGSVFRNIFW